MKMRKLRFFLLVCSLCPCVGRFGEEFSDGHHHQHDNTGLLDLPGPSAPSGEEQRTPVGSVGTGKALEYGRNGDVDVLLVHAPEVEKKFVADGWGVNRRQVMYNDYIVVGHVSDPAGIKGMAAADALKQIAAVAAPFASRRQIGTTWRACPLDKRLHSEPER